MYNKIAHGWQLEFSEGEIESVFVESAMYTPCLCLPASSSCFVEHAVLAKFIQPRFLLCEIWFLQHNTPLYPQSPYWSLDSFFSTRKSHMWFLEQWSLFSSKIVSLYFHGKLSNNKKIYINKHKYKKTTVDGMDIKLMWC